jgi:ATP-dependent DNA helicase DinG
MVSTFTRALQQQILNKDAVAAQEAVAQALGVRVSFARRVGRQNYLSRSACEALLCAMIEEAESGKKPLREAPAEFMRNLNRWLSATDIAAPTIDDYLLTECVEDSTIPAEIDRTSLCLNAMSPAPELEAYRLDVQLTYQADVVIVNHALLMINASRFASILDCKDERPASILVCDEADRLGDAAESVMSSDVSVHRFASMAQAVSLAFDLPQVAAPVDDLLAKTQSVESFGRLVMPLTDAVRSSAARALDVVKPVAVDLSKKIVSGLLPAGDIRTDLAASFCDAVKALDGVSKADSQDGPEIGIVSWSPIRRYPSLRAGRPNPASILRRLIDPRDWDSSKEHQEDQVNNLLPPRSYFKGVFFTSATLAVDGLSLPAAFDHFSRDVGIIRHFRSGKPESWVKFPELTVHNVTTDLFRIYDAPMGFGEMTFVLPAPDAPAVTLKESNSDEDTGAPINPLWIDYCTSMIRAAAAKRGGVLALTLSYANTRELGEQLTDIEGLIVAQPGESAGVLKSRYVARYKSHGDPVLIAPNIWEGIDLPGMVDNLVVTRLPYGSLDGFSLSIQEVSLRSRRFSEDKIASIKFALLSNQARQKFAQGLGRGIRSVNDSVRVWIADPRFPYPESFEDSLDSVLMQRRASSVARMFGSCIPSRFKENYSRARLFLRSGEIYQPEVM